jgi:hypothetical protein
MARKGKRQSLPELTPWREPAKPGARGGEPMGQKSILRACVIGLAAAGAVMAWDAATFAARPGGTIAIADFDFIDTSAEARDQTAEHDRRLHEFWTTLQQKLSAQSFHAVAVPCGKPVCSVSSLGPDSLVAAAKAQDARYLVYGGVHKFSTLVQWMKIEMLDLQTGKAVASKLMTFRGDTDEAYRRAAEFATDDVLMGPLRDGK